MLTVLVGCTLAAPAPAADDDRNFRSLPLPAAASPELQNAIAKSPTSIQGKSPTTLEEWHEEIARRRNLRARLADELADSKNVEIVQSSIGGVTVYRVTPPRLEPQLKDSLFLYLHGGSYVFGGGRGSVYEAILISAATGMRVVAIDYKMPPKHPAPRAVADVVSVYKKLILARDPSEIVIGGTSAGGGLTLATVHRLIELELPLPAALYTGSPWADLTATSDSLHVNHNVDRVLPSYDGSLRATSQLYAGEMDLKDPLISPIYGDFTGFPPAWIVAGTRDILLSDAVRVHRKMRRAGASADLNVFEGMSHAGYVQPPDSPESIELYSELKGFLLDNLANP